MPRRCLWGPTLQVRPRILCNNTEEKWRRCWPTPPLRPNNGINTRIKTIIKDSPMGPGGGVRQLVVNCKIGCKSACPDHTEEVKIEGCDHNKRSSPSTPRGNHLPSTLFDCCIANFRLQGRCGSWRSGLPPHSAKVTHELQTKIGLSAIIRPRPPATPAPTAPQTHRLAGCGRRQA